MRPETIGPYRILETLREGGVSSVYKAAGPGGAAVALKVFSLQVLAPLPQVNAGKEAAPRPQQAEDLVARFHREVGAVVPLSHPNILQVLGTGQDGDHVFLATELFDGLSLERLLKERRLTIQQSIAVLRAVCRGLVFAHARGFVHGHLSPRHVLASPDLRAVKIADFGPSESDVVSELDSTLRTGAYALGSMHYLAPEQIGRRGAPPDPRSDLYAAGVMLVELLTGRLPAGKLALPSHVNAELPPLTDIVVLKCLERDPGQRYPTAAALLADLDRLEEAMRVRLLSHLRGISRLLGPPGSPRRTVLLAALALLLVALALAGYLIAAR
ncbi:MAG TPA: protein kinase [Thermoanaerobaculia bacterium]|jgi:serine/threonine protein kinase|nr:protein kinase [Thermoanaerobaculia bacterium]